MSPPRWRSRASTACRCWRAAAGTSQCGQTVNRALVIDCAKHLNRVLHVDPAARTALVEPGLVLAHLNAALRPHGLFFPVDPSTHARCTLGGMAGNNSCGSKSIRYGLMADNVHAIDALLADGTRHRFGAMPDNLGAEVPAQLADLVQRLRTLGAAEAEEIAARFPRQLRRVGGYNIDVLTPAARAAGRENLARLLVGSEGTLAFSAAIELKLHPIKPRKVLGICQFPSFRRAMEAAQHIVELDPEAVELVDRTMIDLGRGIPIFRATIDAMLIGEPDSLLIVEFHGDADAPLLGKLAELDTLMGDLGHPNAVVRALEPGFQADIAAVREAGLNIMMSMKGDGKPVSFIEDCAVDLPDLADYTERLNDGVRPARHQGNLVRARLGRLPARAPGAEHEGPGRRRNDARGRRGMFRPGARIQGLAFRRARRRHRAQRVQRGDVRRPHRARLRDGEGRVRPARPAQPRARRAPAADGRPRRCFVTARATRRCATSRRNSTGRSIPARTARAACWARSRCATTTAPAARSMPT